MFLTVCFKIYDVDKDDYVSSDDLYQVLKMMTGKYLSEEQLKTIVSKTINETDKDGDGKLSFEEFTMVLISYSYV